METSDKPEKVPLPEGAVLVKKENLENIIEKTEEKNEKIIEGKIGTIISFKKNNYPECLNDIKNQYENGESHLWALCAKVDEKNYVFLEIGSVGNNKNAYTTEIKRNINYMFMSEDNLLKKFERTSHFHKSEWKYNGCKEKKGKLKLKYRDMYRKFSEFMLIIFNEVKFNTEKYDALKLNLSKQRKVEVILAHKYRPLYWHPFGTEWKLLTKL